MEKATENPNSEKQPSPPQPNHQMDADDDDENVKQLKECSSLYLSLQVLLFSQIIFIIIIS
ncbi:Cox19-like CHCH family protein [Hirschfeldia incana]|nr:Cox19-like CHCH family protein [Hirschfeldia incana]